MSIKKSFSLIEVLVFVAILSLFLIISASVVTVSMQRNTLQIHMIKATHYNDLLLGWIKNEKELNWNDFAANTGNTTYCFETDTPSWSKAVIDKNDCTATLGGMYRRYAVFNTNMALSAQIETTIYTEWQEGGNSHSAKLHTLFTLWEEQ
ncbi:MAG: prepilin-type N-terminal cleavage/methylation domain-containing protein [bacterium]